MAAYIRAISAIASIVIIAACAATAPKVKSTAAGVGAAARNPACLTQTGSRIAVNGANCSEIGLSISSDDVSRNGATTAGDALRFNDPSITINH
jgi:hypothetical protein